MMNELVKLGALGPVPRQQFVDPVDWMTDGNAGKDVEPGLWVEVVKPRAPRDLSESAYDPLQKGER
jgi:hypothetical protein